MKDLFFVLLCLGLLAFVMLLDKAIYEGVTASGLPEWLKYVLLRG